MMPALDESLVRSAIERDGFVVVEDVVPPALVDVVTLAIDRAAPAFGVRQRRGSTYAIRNLLEVVPELANLSAVQELIRVVLGADAQLVRAILFDKRPDANWTVGWHQDTTIAVRQRKDVPGFGPWSVKAGVAHVRPPVQVLQSMLTARVHLDDCPAQNGALHVLPGTHRSGSLSPQAIEDCRLKEEPSVCEVARGGVLLMRPLLLHASAPAAAPARRRVVHLEFASCTLQGLEWTTPVTPLEKVRDRRSQPREAVAGSSTRSASRIPESRS
ncbi:MAG: phytanoyl-CoA dioxygenase family protein [Phycisphaerales bacterium]|nr:phytanoyl-CoA dioxygenase family protein [Phycisphaerales bacterium]MCI0630743.1 phytanoyl-CoA dioxygenase family protein [Phycisphaerales bacterium]